MAAYIPVPRDLTKVKSKILFNLTKRQLICFGAAALIGVPSFFLLKKLGNVSLAALGMIVIMLPLFFLAMYERDGQPLEVIVKHIIETRFIRPKIRPYQTDNYYVMRFAPPGGHRCVCQRTLGGDNGQRFNQSLSVQSL